MQCTLHPAQYVASPGRIRNLWITCFGRCLYTQPTEWYRLLWTCTRWGPLLYSVVVPAIWTYACQLT